MKIADLMNSSVKELLNECTVVKINPVTDDEGGIVKIIVEYVPNDAPQAPYHKKR